MTALKKLFTNQWPAMVSAVLLMVISSESRAAEKPNVIVIMADDLGFSDLGCYGGEVETPHLDRLAEESVRFSGFKNT
ncbi:MAG: sulfatase-like hydrolase/transferase, partial [Halioglobus sp.]|nr:sulfatase-like hydrolase/transferase [Halioglobus sp.]